MSHRSRASKARQHVHIHCDSCYSRRCRTRVEVSVSCALIPCRLLCGAVFHLCKEEDHLLLCPNVKVPCLNAAYGCPFHLPRSWQAAHLQVCPASVVSCSMEWNRWPANDAHSYPTTELHENLIRERGEEGGGGGGGGGCLDVAMALKDQDRLFHSLAMKKLFPELMQAEERKEEEKKKKEKKKKEATKDSHTWTPFNLSKLNMSDEKEDEDEDEVEVAVEYEQEPDLTQEEREAIARASLDVGLLDNFSSYERMFSMEMGGCRVAGGARKGPGSGLGTLTEEDTAADDSGVGASASNTCDKLSSPCTALSSSSSSTSTATVKKKKFVYASVEPMKITVVRTFKIPTSFSARQTRIRNPFFYKREHEAVDTSDLGVAPGEMPVWDEVQASLLCSLEKEQRGHLIAESICNDGLLQDEGTQTYSFLSAPFRRDMSLADLTVGKPLELHLQLQVESVTSRHHKASSAFTFLCGHSFHRREYGQHYKNIHCDIQMSVNGWFEQRCPLAYLGCTFSQRRFRPSTHEASVAFNEDLGCFSLHPSFPESLGDAHQPTSESSADSSTAQRRRRRGEDSLSSLPYEVLCHMASFLDSLSLSQLALVSHYMRQVCSSLLQDRGMVTLCWERKSYSHGGAKWRVKHKVWEFSTLFSPVDAWCFRDAPSISEHLKVCPHYERESRSEKIQLPRIQKQVQTNTSCKRPTLVSLFQQQRIMM